MKFIKCNVTIKDTIATRQRNKEKEKRKWKDFWSRRWCGKTWLASSHNHIKITTKIQSNHHSESSEIKVNGNLTTTELKKLHSSRLVGGVHMWNGLVSQPRVVGKNLGEISQKQGVPGPPPKVPLPGRLSPYNFGLQKPAGIEMVEAPRSSS